MPMRLPMRCPEAGQAGFTLLELIVVMSIFGVLAGMAAALMTRPAAQWRSSAERNALTDGADAAMTRMADEIRHALPNSLRVTSAGTEVYVEFLPMSGAGRYRSRPAGDGSGDILDFDQPNDNRFDVLGPDPVVGTATQLVIHNLGTSEGDAWSGNNRRAGLVWDAGQRQLVFTAAGAFPGESPSSRFELVEAPVTLVCRPAADGTGQWLRISGYSAQAAQPVSVSAAPLVGAQQMLLARHVSDCGASYSDSQSTLGVLQLRSTWNRNGETVERVVLVAVDNTP